MRASNRIIVNTLAQYLRTIINMVLSLYSSRIVLDILGIENYGIYALVAGVVSMLSFMTNSLVGSTQRFLSISHGKGEVGKTKIVFNNSMILHVLLGFFITLVLESFSPFLFDGFLNVPESKEGVSKFLYQQVIWMVYLSFMISPYRALLISKENIVYTSIIDIIDGVLKVILVLCLPFIESDKLIAYGWIMLFIQVFNMTAFMAYCQSKYEECSVPKIKDFNLSYVKELMTYTGWVVYSSGVIAFRIQGFAIVLNRMFGTAINAAYGIGAQISGMVSFVSTSFNNAIAPQLIAAEGGGNRERMWNLAEIESKFSFILMAMIGIPTIFEMGALLRIWLVEVPENAVLFARMFLMMQIVDMLSSGLALANRAIGNIGKYTFLTYTPKLFILPLGWWWLKNGGSLHHISFLMVMIEALCVFLRIYFIKKENGFDPILFCKNVIIRSVPPVMASLLICSLWCYAVDFRFRFVLTYIISIAVFSLITYTCSLSYIEKLKVNDLLSIINKKKI